MLRERREPALLACLTARSCLARVSRHGVVISLRPQQRNAAPPAARKKAARPRARRYARQDIAHSWNANWLFSNACLFRLQRHSDHHANAARPYQARSAPRRGPPPCGRVSAEPRRAGLLDARWAPFARRSCLDVWCSLCVDGAATPSCWQRHCLPALRQSSYVGHAASRSHTQPDIQHALAVATLCHWKQLPADYFPNKMDDATSLFFYAAAEQAGWPAACTT